MIPNPDDYDSDREWAIAASERYISSFAAEHDLDPDTIASSDVTDSLSAANLALLEQLRSARESDSSPSTATNRMPGATTRSGSTTDDSSPDDRADGTAQSDESAASTGAVSFTAASGSTAISTSASTSSSASSGSSTPSATSSSSSSPSSVSSSPSPSNDTDTARSDHRNDADSVGLLSPNTWLFYGTLAVLAVFAPVVYYSQTSFALVDLPAAQGTPVAQLPSLLLFAAIVVSVGIFVVSAIPFLVGRYGVLNPPDPETVRQRHTPLRILAHIAALSCIAVIATIGAFIIITGRWPTAYAMEILGRVLG